MGSAMRRSPNEGAKRATVQGKQEGQDKWRLEYVGVTKLGVPRGRPRARPGKEDLRNVQTR